MTAEPPRPISRVVIADPAGRVLLLHFRLRDGLEVWIPPGGGVELGESPLMAAVREVREETTIELPERLHLAWIHSTHYGPRPVIEHYYFIRLPETPAVTASVPEDAPATLLAHRWWSLADLEAGVGAAELTPPTLAELLKPLLAGELPRVPLQIKS